jgi:hypothetical protein
MRYLHLKSGSLQRPSDFALQVRQLARRQAVPGYRLAIEQAGRTEWLTFRPDAGLSTASVEEAVDGLWMDSVDHPHGSRWIARSTHGGSPAPIGPQAAPSMGLRLP